MTLRTLDQLVGPADHAAFGQDWEWRSKPLTQRGGDVYLVPHHSVSRTIGAIMAEFKSPNRELSATVACGPDVAGQDAYRQINAVPWNTGRPFTTSSWVDDIAFTFEMANLALTPPYPVGSTGKSWLVEVIAAMHVELGMPIDRWHVADHSEIYERGWGSYPTACCGDDLRNYLDQACVEARQLVATNGIIISEEETMYPILWNNHVFTFGVEKVNHIEDYDSAWYMKNVLTADDKFIPATNPQFTALCVSFGVPWYAVDACLKGQAFNIDGTPGDGRFWSRQMELMAAVKGLSFDPEAMNQTIEASIAAGLEGVSIGAQISDEDIRRIQTGTVDELKGRL